jgi:Mrp family chromosome partitioning ATPase
VIVRMPHGIAVYDYDPAGPVSGVVNTVTRVIETG